MGRQGLALCCKGCVGALLLCPCPRLPLSYGYITWCETCWDKKITSYQAGEHRVTGLTGALQSQYWRCGATLGRR